MPGLLTADAGRTSAIATTNHPSLATFNPHLARGKGGRYLFHGERRRWVHRLLGYVVVHLDAEPIKPRGQTGGREGLFQGHLVANIAHLVGRFYRVYDWFVSSRVDDIVFHGGGGLVGLFVHREVIDLHPEVEPLVSLEHRRLAIR